MALGTALSGIHNIDESQINEIDHNEDSAAQREDTMCVLFQLHLQ